MFDKYRFFSIICGMGHYGGGWFAYLRYEQKDRPAITWELLGRVWDFARPYRFRVVGLLITVMLITGVSLLNPLILRNLIDYAIPEGDRNRLNLLAITLLVIPILNAIIGRYQRELSASIGEGVIFDLRCALYNHMQRMSLRFFSQTRTGELMSRLNSDVVGAQSAVTSTFVNIVTNLFTVIGTLAIMFTLEWRLTLLALIVIPIFIVLARQIGNRLRDLRRRSMEYNSEMSAMMNETLNVSGALLVKLFGREKDEQAKFAEYAKDVRDIGIRSALISHWFFVGLGIATALGTALVYWLGGSLAITSPDEFSIGTIVAFVSYLGQLYGPLTSLTNSPIEFIQSLVSFERVFEVLDIPVEITEKKNAKQLPKAKGHIQFNHVQFEYGEEDHPLSQTNRSMWDRIKRGKQAEDDENGDQSAQPVNRWSLKDLNFEIKPGQLAALVGPSGAGKTTITYMIPRLYDPTGGQVCLDGHDLRDLTLDSLSANIGMVTQETYLFYDTVRANLLYANPNATERAMIEAAQAANIHDFIASLPDGYDTVVGERGYRLSGGERQRIAIARVILKNPQILVLDEATSSLDSLSEAMIQDALQRVMKDRTSIVIAHRLSTILSADKILVINQGELVEAGTHAELLAIEGGLYHNLYETQFKSS